MQNGAQNTEEHSLRLLHALRHKRPLCAHSSVSKEIELFFTLSLSLSTFLAFAPLGFYIRIKIFLVIIIVEFLSFFDPALC